MENNKNQNGFPFFKILYKNIVLLIIITVIIGVFGSFIGSAVDKPSYTKKCEVMLRVNVGYGSINISNNTSVAKDYLPTVAGAIRSPATMEIARTIRGAENIDTGIKRNSVSVSYTEDSLIFSISYTDSTPELAERRLKDVLSATNVLLTENSLIAVRSVELIELQNTYSTSTSSDLIYYVVASWAIGIAIAVVVVVLKHLLDNKMKTTADLEEFTESEVLACIDK